MHEACARDVAQGRTPHRYHARRYAKRKPRPWPLSLGRLSDRELGVQPPITSSFTTATLRYWPKSLEVIQQTASMILSALGPALEQDEDAMSASREQPELAEVA